MKWLAYRYLMFRGWRFIGELPGVPKMIIIGAPHTSNWDFILFLGALYHFDMTVRYLGKHQLFRWPFGRIFTALGGIPVNRGQAGGVVRQTKKVFDSVDEMILVIAPEGTRSAAGEWKSGFLKIAEAAKVPVVLAGVHGPNKTVEIGPALTPGLRFMDEVRDFYSKQPGLKPSGKSSVRLRGETLSS